MKSWASLSRVSATHNPFAFPKSLQPLACRSWPLAIAPVREHSIAVPGNPVDDASGASSIPSTQEREGLAPKIKVAKPRNAAPTRHNSARAPASSKRTEPRASIPESLAKSDPRAETWVATIVGLLNSGKTVLDKKALSLHHNKSPAWVWVASAHWLLEHDFVNLLRLLKATHLQSYLPSEYVDGFLLSVADARSHPSRQDSPELVQMLVDVFCLLCDRRSGGSTAIKRNLSQYAWSLMQVCSSEQVVQMFHSVKLNNIDLQWSSLLHFADRLTKHNHFEDGLDALLGAQKAGALVNEFPFRSCCSTILRRSIEQPEGLRVCLRIVSTLVELGLEMNHTICNIIMLNAAEAGDLRTTFSVYHLLKQRGLRPNEGTIAALLTGCKMKIDDVAMLNETIRDAVKYLNVRKSELVACEILHCLALHHCKHHPETALETLTEAYAQFFELKPLLKLGLPITTIEQPVGEYLVPNQNALNIMIEVSIKQRLVHLPYHEGILPLYQRWRRLIETGDTSCLGLATTDYTANIFLMAFIQREDGLVHGTQVIHDMQQPLPASAGVEQAKPTVQTWSILLHGFSLHGKTPMAEMVLQSMRSAGVEPNSVTWNSLMLGYARAQNEEGTLAAVRRARESGMVWDEWTHGGLRGLPNIDRVQEELARSSVQMKTNMVD